MGYLSDITDAARAVAVSANSVRRDLRDARDELAPQSITMAGRSLDGTLQFPMLTTDTISIATAGTLARTMERVYASFAQTVISMNSTIDISADKSPIDFLKKFHRNVKTMESEEIQPYMELIEAGKYSAFVNESFNLVVLFNESDKPTAKMLKENRALLEAADFTEARKLPKYQGKPMYEAIMPADMMPYMNREKAKLKDYDVQNKPQLMNDNDVKKENDVQPFTMSVRLMAVNDKKEFVQFMDFVMGVKVVLHNIHSDEIISNCIRAISNNGFFFKFLRWTTGEKSLFGDLLLNVNDVKLDAVNQSKGSSRWWQTLKRMKERKNQYVNLFGKNRMIPNSTLVITEYEVNKIKEASGYDLNDAKIAKKLVNQLFLMALIIVSDSTETFKVIYADAGPEYQYYSLDLIQKEVTNRSNRLGREIERMLGSNR